MKPSNDGAETELKRLQRLWYEKLKAKGFKDIEHNEFKLKVYDSSEFRKPYKVSAPEDVLNYYISAEHFLNSHQFKSKLEKFIWEQHSNAVSLRSTVKLLKLKKIIMTVWGVNSVLKKIKREFSLYRRTERKGELPLD